MHDSDRYDVVVVGVGGMGSAACYHLARRGADVLGLERFDVPHARGSSHGDTRMIRLAYHEHPSYVPLLRRAYETWRELESDSGRDLLHVTGSLAAGTADSETVAGARESCETYGLDHEVLTGDEVTERVPALTLPDDFRAVAQPQGGFVDAEGAVEAHVEGAFAHGAEIRAREAVESWTETADGVRVVTEKGRYEADHLVLAAGAWAGDLLSDLAPDLTVQRQVMRWFYPEDPAQFTPASFPVFILDAPEDLYYGFPRYGAPGVKVGIHYHFEETVDPDELARDPRREDERALTEGLDRYLPAAAGPTLALRPCLYTNTPDKDFVVDRYGDAVSVAAGFSGHGFKFAGVVGEILADLALEGETAHDVSAFALDRL